MITPAQKQLVVAVSTEMKQFLKDCSATYSAPSKSKDVMNATEREVADAMMSFVEKHRYQTCERFIQEINDETGEVTDTDEIETYEVDNFEIALNEIMAQRMTTTRTNVASGQLAALKAEHEKLLAELAALRGQTPPPLPA